MIIKLYKLQIIIILLFLLISCDDKEIVTCEWRSSRKFGGIVVDTCADAVINFDTIKSSKVYIKNYNTIAKMIKTNNFKEGNIYKINSSCYLEYERIFFKDNEDTLVLVALKNNKIDSEDFYVYSSKYGIVGRSYYHFDNLELQRKIIIQNSKRDTIDFVNYMKDIRLNSKFWIFGE